MDFFNSAPHLTMREAYENVMRSHFESCLLTHNGKRWLFERKNNSVSIRPIHGFVVSVTYTDPGGGKDYVRYISNIGWNKDGWTQYWDSSSITVADVFYNLSELDKFLEEIQRQVFELSNGKSIFVVPVTVENGMAS